MGMGVGIGSEIPFGSLVSAPEGGGGVVVGSDGSERRVHGYLTRSPRGVHRNERRLSFESRTGSVTEDLVESQTV